MDPSGSIETELAHLERRIDDALQVLSHVQLRVTAIEKNLRETGLALSIEKPGPPLTDEFIKAYSEWSDENGTNMGPIHMPVRDIEPEPPA